MLVVERFRERRRKEEEERRRELRLSNYSERLSHRLLTNNGKEELSQHLPNAVVTSFQIGSLKDRDSYWQEKTPAKNFGQQMVDWLGTSEKPGMSQWLEGQQNAEANLLLQAVGLKASSEQTAAGMKDPKVERLVATINGDLRKEGEPSVDELTEGDKQALIFYAKYLNPTDTSGKEARALIETLVDKARALSNGDSAQTLARLQAVSPLFNVVGEDAQHALGALVVAHAHGSDAKVKDLLQQANLNQLSQEESHAWEFIRQNREAKKAEPLKPGEQQNVVGVLTNLEPEVEKEGNPYFIEGDLPADVASQLSPEQLRGWEIVLPLFQNVKFARGEMRRDLNRAIFDPAYTLEKNPRFYNGELLTNEDSGLFALAAASAPTPEKQAVLYKTLGEVILRTHDEDRQLLQRFLEAQTDESQRALVAFDMTRMNPVLGQFVDTSNTDLKNQFRNRFGQEFSSKLVLTDEQRDFLKTLALSQTEKHSAIYQNIANQPDRVVALREELGEGLESLDQLNEYIDISNTLAAWPGRISALQEALHQDPLTLSPEQIRQIEFLAHSVDAVKVMEHLKGVQQNVAAPEVAQPTRRMAPAPMVEIAPELTNVVAPAVVGPELPATDARPELPVAESPALTGRVEAAVPAAPERETGSLEQLFGQLTIPPKEGNNFYTDTPDSIRPVRRIVDNWKSYLLRVPVGEQKTPPNLGTYILHENPQTGEIDVKGIDFRKPFLQNLLQVGTRANEAQDFLWHNNTHYYSMNNANDNYEMDATLFAFAADAGATPKDQASIFSSMAQQVLLFYDANPDLIDTARSYFTHVNRYGYKWPRRDIDALLGTQLLFHTRSREIRDHMRQDALTPQDMLDISLLALPFDLRKLAKDMQQQAQAPTNQTEGSPAE